MIRTLALFFFLFILSLASALELRAASIKSLTDTLPRPALHKMRGDTSGQDEDVQDSDFAIKHPLFKIKLGNEAALKGKKVHSSRRAWMLSVAFPGGGQLYNHRYWKLPIIYGGFIGLGLTLNFYQNQYNQTLQYYKLLLVNPASPSVPVDYRNAPITLVASIKDSYRRSRDLAIIGSAILLLANAVDAYVDSELKGFDVSNSLSMRVRPYVAPAGFSPGFSPQPVLGLRLVMSIK